MAIMDQKLFVAMERIRERLSKRGKHNHEREFYQPTYKQIEAAKLKIRKDKGEVFVDLD